MGVINVDTNADYSSVASGASYSNQSSSVISKYLSQDELPMSPLFSLRSGGEAGFPFFTPATGSNVYVEQSSKTNLTTVVDEICSSFDLSKDELARVCKVKSRRTLYNWISGKVAPRKKAMSRLFDLLMLSKRVQSSGLKLGKELIHQKVIDGASVFDMLSDEFINEDLIIFSLSRLSLNHQSVKTLDDPFA